MARLMGRRMVAPINSVKHYVGQPKFAVALGTRTTLEVADVVVPPVSPEREKVSEGSLIKAIYFEFWLSAEATSGVLNTFVMTIEKSPSGVADPAFSDMFNLGGYANKKNILYTTQAIVGTSFDGPAIPVIRNWLKIPKGKQRMGHKDRILITFASQDVTMAVCGFTTYKEYV